MNILKGFLEVSLDHFKNSEIKKINKDNNLDVYVPSLHKVEIYILILGNKKVSQLIFIL